MSHNRDLSAAAAQLGFHSSNIGIGTETPGAILEVFDATSNTIVNVKSGDSGAVLNLIDDSARSSIEQNGTTLKISSDTGAEDASSDIRLQVDGSTKMTIDSSSRVLIGRTSTSHEHPLQVQAANGANAVAIQGRSVDDQSEITFYENDNTTILGQIQHLRTHSTYRHRVGYLRFDSGGYNEKMRLTSGGDLGIGDSDPSSSYGTNLSVHSTATDGARLKLSDGTSGKGNLNGFDLISTGGIAYIIQRQNADMVFSTNNTEKMRLDSGGRLLLNSGTDVRLELGTTGSTGTNNRNHLRGDGANMKYNCCSGGGHFFEANGGERMRISSNGLMNIGDGYIVTNTGLHVGRGSGGTAAGESVLGATLGNDSTMVSALLTVKNAGNRGGQGASGGSPLAKFEFNNGTAFELDKYGRRTLQYQPACKVSIDTNGTGGGNYAQTGNTVIPFNSTGYGYNIGNHFNTSNHTFTAPLAGRYLVLLSLNVIGDNIVYIYKNGSANVGGEYRSNPVGTWEHCELSGVIDCSANDTIKTHSYLLSTSGGRKFNGGTNPGTYWDTLSIYYLG